MKKILGILFFLIIAAAFVTFYFFPGIPYYYKSTHDFRTTDNIIEETPDNLPELSEGYTSYSQFGIKLTAWDVMKQKRTENKDSYILTNEDESHCVSITVNRISEEYNFLDMTGITPEALKKFCKKAEKTPPVNRNEFVRLAASLTMEDFDVHDMKNAKTFYKLMEQKNSIAPHSGLYLVDGVGYHGVMEISDLSSEKEAKIFILPEKDEHKSYMITVSLNDRNEALAVAGSIKLT